MTAIFISMYNDKRTQTCILVEQRGSKWLSVSNLFEVSSSFLGIRRRMDTYGGVK